MNLTPTEPAAEVRVASDDLLAIAAPRRGAPWRGRIAAGASFEVFGHVKGAGCDDWGVVAGGTYACLDGTTPGTRPAVVIPTDGRDGPPLLYARRAKGLPGPMYADLDAWLAGDAPKAWMRDGYSYAFVDRVDTPGGAVLVRADGRVVPAARVRAYEPSAFSGRDLVAEPLPEGAELGWCIARQGCEGTDGRRLAFHDAFTSDTFEPTEGALVRTWRPAAPPTGVGPDDVWIDVDTGEQTLAVLQGANARFVTLVSTGIHGRNATPHGETRVTDKLVHNDMASLPGAEEPYVVETVPWVVHFRPRYALHGAYWHDKFGLRTSHGCVNLSPTDARAVFDAVLPALPPGWSVVYAAPDTPPTRVRVR